MKRAVGKPLLKKRFSPHPNPGTPKALQVRLGEPRTRKLQKEPAGGAKCSFDGLLLRNGKVTATAKRTVEDACPYRFVLCATSSANATFAVILSEAKRSRSPRSVAAGKPPLAKSAFDRREAFPHPARGAETQKRYVL